MNHPLDATLERPSATRSDPAARQAARLARAGGWTLDHMWIITSMALVWVFVSLLPLPPHDLWWHLAAGRTMVADGALMHTNEWSYAVPRDTPYIYQSWLSELFLYGLWHVGDIPLLVLIRSVVITASFGLVAWHALRRAANGKLVMLALLAAVLVSWDNWSLRPQTLALLPAAAFIVVLGEYTAGRWRTRLLALLPFVMLLWVNLHGSFVLGGAFLALTTLGAAIEAARATTSARRATWQRVGALTATGIATGAAMLVNPLGIGIVGYVRDLFGNSTVQTRILEWMPPSNDIRLANPGFWFFVVLLGLAVLMATAPRRPSAVDLCMYCGLGWLAIGGVRHVMWFALAAFPIVAAQLASWGTRRPIAWGVGPRRLHTALALVVGFAMLPWFLPSRYLGPASAHLYANDGPYPHMLSNTTPVAATTWLIEHPIAGRLWTDMAYSNYVVWRMPDQQIFVDSRIELYPKDVWDDNFAIARANAESLALLDKWQVTHIMIRAGIGAELSAFLTSTPGWCERYHDQESVIIDRCP